jgi:hypothetical protein
VAVEVATPVLQEVQAVVVVVVAPLHCLSTMWL